MSNICGCVFFQAHCLWEWEDAHLCVIDEQTMTRCTTEQIIHIRTGFPTFNPKIISDTEYKVIHE